MLLDLAMTTSKPQATAGDQFPEIVMIAIDTTTGPCNSESGNYT